MVCQPMNTFNHPINHPATTPSTNNHPATPSTNLQPPLYNQTAQALKREEASCDSDDASGNGVKPRESSTDNGDW